MDFKRRTFLDDKRNVKNSDVSSRPEKDPSVVSAQAKDIALSSTAHQIAPPEKKAPEKKAPETKLQEIQDEHQIALDTSAQNTPSRFLRLNKARNHPALPPKKISDPNVSAQAGHLDNPDGGRPAWALPSTPLVGAPVSDMWGFSGATWQSLDGHPWNKTLCPKCQKLSVVGAPLGGLFLCLHCPFHGDTSVAPKTFRSSWLFVMQEYLSVGDKSKAPEKFQDSVLKGVFAYAWNESLLEGACLEEAWYLPSYDEKENLKDALFTFDGVKKNKHLGAGSNFSWSRLNLPAYPYGLSALTKQRVVMVSDPDDYDALQKSGVENILILPPDLDKNLPMAEAWHMMDFMEKSLSDVTEIVLAFHSSVKWRDIEDELGRRLDKERCFRARWSLYQDTDLPEDAEANAEVQEGVEEEPLLHHEEKTATAAGESFGLSALQTLIDTAHPFPVAGIHELDEIDDQFESLYITGLSPGAATGWPSMDTHYTVKPGQWTVVTGIPGHGKSSWLDALLVNLASMHGWRFGMFSPENQPIERHFASLMEKKLKKPFSEGPMPRITNAEKNNCKKWLNDKFKIILPTDDGLWTLESVLKLARILVYRYGIRGLVIDPWNELDHSVRPNQNETTYISECLTKVRRFARLYDVHVWVVAHPTKLEKKADQKYPVATPYDISGGAHWRNKADNAISVYRNVNESDDDVSDVYVQKIRFKEIGCLGRVSLRSDRASGHYIDDIDQKKREMCIEKNLDYSSAQMRTPSPRKYPSGPPLEYESQF